MTVLTLDLGSTATKAALWEGNDLLAIERAALATTHPGPDRAEQDADDWLGSVVDACGALRTAHPKAYADIAIVAFAAARETFVFVDDALEPIAPGVLWSDQRGTAAVLHFGDPDEFRDRTGVVLNAACCAGKVAWFTDHERALFDRARWVLAPRDLVFARLTGEVRTDETLASRTGFYDLDGTLGVKEELAEKLPPVATPITALPVHGASGRLSAETLGLRVGIPVVIGAGDRACEVLGSGASAPVPMVSWGTTTNLSVPHPGPRDALPSVAAVSRGATGGYLVEAGLSASGAAVEWLARLTSRPVDLLLAEAAATPPGAEGLLALP